MTIDLALILGIVAAVGGFIWRALAATRGAGKAAEALRQERDWHGTQDRVDRAVAGVDGLPDADVRQRLRQQWGGAAAGPGAAVQPGPADRDSGRR